MKHKVTWALLGLLLTTLNANANPQLQLSDQQSLHMPGLQVIAFSDIYPDGHQTGVTIIQHGLRVAANGDIRLEAAPGPWSPVPKSSARKIDAKKHTIIQSLAYPDPTKDGKGFNPIDYPDLRLAYQVSVKPLQDSSFEVTVNLSKPIPKDWVGKVGFNLEFSPTEYIGHSFQAGNDLGVFQRQPGSESLLGEGKTLVVGADSAHKSIKIISTTAPIQLHDGRIEHHDGWFVARSLIPKGTTKNAVRWVITPNVIDQWQYEPVIQVSQIGYRPKQAKRILIEQDNRDESLSPVTIFEITPNGKKPVFKASPKAWGEFYGRFYGLLDFSYLDKPGVYVAQYREQTSSPFKVDDQVYARHVWQPTLEFFLPIQMCHVKVEQKRRVWHELCHEDDALMSPINHIHFAGYFSDPTNYTTHPPKAAISLINRGGWHDGRFFDLKIEEQAETVWLLAAMIEEFDLQSDATTINQQTKQVLLQQPDGIPDAVQQVQHGMLSVLGGYQNLGRLYRGIVSPNPEQYWQIGSPAAQTDGYFYDPLLAENEVQAGKSGVPDDRWIFTENNPDRALNTAAAIAAASRVLETTNRDLSLYALKAATDITLSNLAVANASGAKVFALVELYLATKDRSYLNSLFQIKQEVVDNISETGWHIARIKHAIKNTDFLTEVGEAVSRYQEGLRAQSNESPYSIPSQFHIWGNSASITGIGVRQYYYHKAWPEYANPDIALNALNFVLGVHPGGNPISYVSGVGAQSALTANGLNRADWSHIPGGMIAGASLIRPNFLELKNSPYIAQQTSYSVSGSAQFMFLALAANRLE